MPTITGETTALEKLMSEIYGRKWSTQNAVTDKDSSTPSRRVKFTGHRHWNDIERNGRRARPFSANLITSNQPNTRSSMSHRPRTSALADAEHLNTATFKRKKKLSSKIPEYDSRKVISDSASARNTALAAEYIEMLSGKNYLKRHYREQYWVHDAASRNRPQTTGASSGESRYATLYPDLGSVLGNKTPPVRNTTPIPESTPRFKKAWRLPSTPRNNVTRVPAATQISNNFSEEKRVVVAELGVTFEAKKSCSSIHSGKCQRVSVPYYPNDTLASLCLEGRSAPSRTSNSRTSSLSSAVSIPRMLEGRYSSAGESTLSGSSDTASGSRTGSGDEEPMKSYVDSVNENVSPGETESANATDAKPIDIPRIVDSVFEDEDDQVIPDDDVIMDEAPNDDDCDELISDTIEKGVGRMSFSDLEESDISENEADDYEEDAVDETEVSRRLKQVSAVFDSTRQAEFHVAVAVNPGNDGQYSESGSDSDHGEHYSGGMSESLRYPTILPQPYSEFDLKGFANLPPGMDWRAFVQNGTGDIIFSPKLHHSSKDNEQGVKLRRKNERESAKRRNIEGFVDRLVMLEKLQVISVQFERDRKKHLIHRAKVRNIAKAATNSSSATSSSANATVSTSPKDSEGRPPSARVLRRRPSSVGSTSLINNKSRKSQSDSKPEQFFGNKSSPDLDLVRLSCTKNHLQYLRRNSASPRKKQRPSLFLPRHYEYCWSERLPPSKRPSLNSLFYAKPRNCQYCRDSERRAHLQSLQILMNRPRSSSCNINNRQAGYRTRPGSSSAIMNTAQKHLHISEGRHESSTPRNITCNQVAAPGSRESSTLRRTTSASGVQARINVARVSLASVARDYAKAADQGVKVSRRTFTSSCRSWRSGRSSPCVNMNKKK